MLRNLSIKTRIIIWNAGVLMLILCLLSAGIYLFMRNSLAVNLQNKVDGGFKTIETVLRNSQGDIMDLYHLGQDILYAVKKGEEVVYKTDAWTNAPWTSGLNWESFHAPGDVPAGDREYRLQLGDVEEYGYRILFAYDVTGAYDSLNSLLVILIGAVPAALILAVLGGSFLAGRVLSPLKDITRTARHITAENLEKRLPVKNPGDELGQLAQTFNETLARLNDSFDRLKRFTADASHELRTPLTSIRSVGEVALSGSAKDVNYREAIGSMLEDTERLTRLVDSLLILARSDARRIDLSRESLHLSRIVAEAVEELMVLAEDRKQILRLAEQQDIVFHGDRATLRQAVVNVIHNAIRYTPIGGEIQVRVESGDGKARITIEDNGPGIPEGERERVFQRFYRMDKARSSGEGGTGLGLSIAKWAVEANGGSIAFSPVEQGSRCEITLPLDNSRRERK
jgi:heavy metal sensor kinase